MRRLMWFSVGFVLSCIIGIYLYAGPMLLWAALAAVILACISIFIKWKPFKIGGVLLLGFAVGVSWMWCYNAFYLQPARYFDEKTAVTSIEISDYSYATQYGGAVDGNVRLNGLNYKVRVYLDDYEELKPGDCIEGEFQLAMTVPGATEESDYYQGKGIFLLANAESDVAFQPADTVPFKYFAVRLRRQISDLLSELFPNDTVGFARALLLGDSSLLTYEEDTSFKVSGIRHIIAVSGLHVSILFSVAYTLGTRRGIPTALIGVPILLLFAAVTGFTPSVVRACVMQLLVILALLLKREYDPPTALAFAVLVILVLNPMAITSVSFQLSVGCMVGIFSFSKPIQSHIFGKMGSPTGKSLRARFTRWFSSGVGVTLSAMAVTTPLVAWYFGLVSLVSVLANLVTLWVISFVFCGIILACVCGALFLPVGKVIAFVISWAMRYVLFAAKWLASIPIAAVYTRSVYIVLWILISYVLIAGFLLCRKERPVLLTVCILTCLCGAVTAAWIAPRQDAFRVTVFAVGEGQAILLQSNRECYLVDCGGTDGDAVADTVAETLLSQGIFRLDGIILTHYDADHTNGVFQLLSRVKTARLCLPDIPDDGSVKEELSETYADRIFWVRQTTELNDLTMIPALTDAENENENSLCVLFQPDNCDILITGDRGESGEKALLKDFALPELELLIAGHHGAAASTGLELLGTTTPQTVAISTVGRYNHPAEAVLYRLDLFGCDVHRTDLNGTLVFKE